MWCPWCVERIALGIVTAGGGLASIKRSVAGNLLTRLGQLQLDLSGSKAEEGTGGRTQAFGVRKASTIVKPAVVYQAPNVELYRAKPNLIDIAEE